MAMVALDSLSRGAAHDASSSWQTARVWHPGCFLLRKHRQWLMRAVDSNPIASTRQENHAVSYETLIYSTDGPVATITLSRPERLNTIVPPMPDEFEAAIKHATLDAAVTVIVLRGAGRSFCAGYDFADGFHHWDEMLTTDGQWDPGKDFIGTGAYGPTQKFMSIWRTPKPVIAQIHGWCVGGGSDMALCADLIIASEDAQIGTPYSRIWGCYLSGMWLYRLGLTKAK